MWPDQLPPSADVLRKCLRKGTIKATKRTQSSICVSGDGVNWVLFNTSPDILQQIQEFAPLQPGRAIRDSGIVGIGLFSLVWRYAIRRYTAVGN